MPKGKGDCYQVTGDFITEEFMRGSKDVLLCHGEVKADGQERWHGHAWIECTQSWGGRSLELVRDMSNGNDVLAPKNLYYGRGHVRNVTRYTPDEAIDKILMSGHYGPWENNQEGDKDNGEGGS